MVQKVIEVRFVVVDMDAPDKVFLRGFEGFNKGVGVDVTNTLVNALKFNDEDAAIIAMQLAGKVWSSTESGWGVREIICVGGTWELR